MAQTLRTQHADLPGIRRGMLFIRNCGTATEHWMAAGTAIPATAYALVGVAEVDEDSFQDEVIHDFGILGGTSRFHLAFEGRPRELEDYTAYCDLPSLATDLQCYRPSDVMAALGWGGGGMVLRKTRGPSSPGTTLCTVLMLMCLPGQGLPDAHMAEFTASERPTDRGTPGAGRLTVTGPSPKDTRGDALASILKAPLWGWGDEPHGFASLMRLDMIDTASKLQEMLNDENADPAEIARLRKLTGNAVQNNSDERYVEFRRLMVAELGFRPWDETPTASEVAARGKVAERIIRRVMA